MKTLYEQLRFEHQRLEQEIHSIHQIINELPEGKLIFSRNGKRIKFYQSNGHDHTYIPQKDRQLTEQLAIKKYLSLRLEDLQQEQKAIDFYLRHHTDSSRADQLLTDDSVYAELLSSYFSLPTQELIDWATSPYEHNQSNPEQLIHKTNSGHIVRSKSESMIAMALYLNRIPFRYECALLLDEITLFPDFTIRHPRTGQIYYWEHFGLMDNPNYCKNTFSKLQLYASHNIIPSIHLLTTYETQKNPLNSDTIENMICQYFLKG